MRNLGLAIVAAGVLAWPSATARAQTHDYYVVAVGDEQAVLIDRATRARVGDIVTLDLIVLQKQPSTVTGQQTYWVDGVQEIDCVNHRQRLMLIAALPLDRSRKFNSPNAAFRPWTSNAPGSDTRAVEDFVCREGSSPGIRMVADLTAFQRRFFNGEAGLADRGERSIADARAALQAQRGGAPPPAPSRPAPPQSPPPAPPPLPVQPTTGATYYAFSRNDERVQLINRDQIVRGQGFATAPSIILMRSPIREGGRDFHWIDATVQFECAANRVRTRVQAMYNLDRSSRSETPNAGFSDWTPVGPGSAGAEVQGLVCYTTLAPGIRQVTDLTAFQRNYFAATPGPGQTQAQGPAPMQGQARPPTSPPRPSPPASEGSLAERGDRAIADAKAAYERERAQGARPAMPAGGPAFYLTSYDKQSAELFEVGQARRVGDIVKSPATVLTLSPKTFSGVDYYWTERFYEFDCVQHRSRDALLELKTLDRKSRVAMPRMEYSAWAANAPGSVDGLTEAMLCKNTMAPGFQAVADLAAFQRSYFAYARGGEAKLNLGQAPQITADQPPARPAAASTPSKLKPYYVINNDSERASVLTTTDAVRTGDLVTALNVMLLIKPVKAGGEDVYWLDGLMQVDCVKHQSRSMLTAARPLDRSKRIPFPNPSYEPWENIRVGDAAADAETILCSNRAPQGPIPIDDLMEFQKQFYAFAAQKKK